MKPTKVKGACECCGGEKILYRYKSIEYKECGLKGKQIFLCKDCLVEIAQTEHFMKAQHEAALAGLKEYGAPIFTVRELTGGKFVELYCGERKYQQCESIEITD